MKEMANQLTAQQTQFNMQFQSFKDSFNPIVSFSPQVDTSAVPAQPLDSTVPVPDMSKGVPDERSVDRSEKSIDRSDSDSDDEDNLANMSTKD